MQFLHGTVAVSLRRGGGSAGVVQVRCSCCAGSVQVRCSNVAGVVQRSCSLISDLQVQFRFRYNSDMVLQVW